jgi:hypothetical protein
MRGLRAPALSFTSPIVIHTMDVGGQGTAWTQQADDASEEGVTANFITFASSYVHSPQQN